MREETCRHCGQQVLMMCQEFTGFCCARCEEEHDE